MTEKTISYTKYEWKDEAPTHIVTTQRTAQIRDDLTLTLGRMGIGDFFKHVPLETLEQFLRDITTGGVDLAYEEQILKSGLNNFMLLMPGQEYNKHNDLLIERGHDKTLREMIVQTAENNAAIPQTEEYKKATLRYAFTLHSDKRLDETADSFHDNIDKAIIECGYSVEEIMQAAVGGMVQAVDFYKTYWPIYIELRKMGYAHRDLVA